MLRHFPFFSRRNRSKIRSTDRGKSIELLLAAHGETLYTELQPVARWKSALNRERFHNLLQIKGEICDFPDKSPA